MAQKLFDLSGKVALITGGGGGIGAATVRMAAGLGAKVVLHDVRAGGAGERLAAELGMDMGDAYELDLTGMKASFGLDASVKGVTYRELQERREIIRDRLQKHDRKAAKHK